MSRFEEAPGATPIGDADGLLIDALTMADLSAAEGESILAASGKLLRRRHDPRRAWLTEELLRAVHKEMFGAVWDWAGRYRDRELTIGIPHHRIREEVKKLCDDVRFWDTDSRHPLSVPERACRLHHRLAWIHPFRNGNGRHARLVCDLYLNAHGLALPVWPSADIALKGGARDAYLAALKAADKNDFGPLVRLSAKHTSGN